MSRFAATVARPMPAAETRRSTLQQERSREARRKLAHAANTLWMKKGFDETSVSDICQLAKIPRANFYFYFHSREDLLFELGLEAVEAVALAARDTVESRSTDDALRTIVRAFARQAQRTPKPLLDRTVLQLMSRTERWEDTRGDQPGFYQFLLDLVRVAQTRGEIAEGVTEDEAAQTLGAVLREGLLAWARDQVGGMSLEDVLYRRMRIVLNGAAIALDPPT